MAMLSLLKLTLQPFHGYYTILTSQPFLPDVLRGATLSQLVCFLFPLVIASSKAIHPSWHTASFRI